MKRIKKEENTIQILLILNGITILKSETSMIICEFNIINFFFLLSGLDFEWKKYVLYLLIGEKIF